MFSWIGRVARCRFRRRTRLVGSGRAARARWVAASIPSISGMRMSISTTSGSIFACRGERLAADARLADNRDAGFGQEPSIRRPSHTRSWSSAISTVIFIAQAGGPGAAHRVEAEAWTLKPPPGRVPAASPPPNNATRSRMPASPWPPPCSVLACGDVPSSVASMSTASAPQLMLSSALYSPTCLPLTDDTRKLDKRCALRAAGAPGFRWARFRLSEVMCGQGRGRTADLPLFRRTLVPTELPDLGDVAQGSYRCGPDGI